MCGRFALTLPMEAVRQHFRTREDALGGVEPLHCIDEERYNIRPTQPICAIIRTEIDGGATDRVAIAARWGFVPEWAKTARSAPLINARSETIAEKPTFAEAARRRRCLIPADGFYEWRTLDRPGGKPMKEPHWIFAPSAPLIAFAGVWSLWRDAAGRVIPTVAIVTAAATGAIAQLHERTPVPIAPEQYGLWLGEEGKGAARLMRAPHEAFFTHHPVSPRINKGGADAPDDAGLRAHAETVVDPEPIETPNQGSLF